MRACVQLGLLFLSLFISSLDGEEIDSEISMQVPPNMDEDMDDFPRFQVAENEQERNLLSHNSDIILANFRVKRQDNGKKPKRKKTRPGSSSALESMTVATPRVRRQTGNNGKRKPKGPKPGMFSILAKLPSQDPASSGKIITA
ncbi:uncharacterized protein si:ch211-106h4.12 [Triplophysa dalaica]|uniref:uncharacterized protein si:ch211-106h4.12 n=1 Tax=Triplophysa dalaica TaxID=1582913 RepID=UPI0024E0192D|nr:uncharacterized protein si:ch211-106h4.12 [Triplophysa dalaica]